MPAYDYVCTGCRLQFEARHAIDAPTPECPSCGSAAERVILTAPALHGHMARGRDLAMRSLQPQAGQDKHGHGPGCGCGCGHHPHS